MRGLSCVLLLAQLAGCSSGGSAGGSSTAQPPADPVVSSPRQLLATAGTDGLVLVSWNASAGLAYDLYFSTDPAVTPENYSVYDNAGLVQGVHPPFEFHPDEPGETYTLKLIARSDSGRSEPATATAYTRFIVSSADPAVYVDRLLDLEIKRCSEGQQYDYLARQCQGDAARYSPDGLAAHMALTGDDWRLATTAEMQAISPCGDADSQLLCVPENRAYIIADFFLGSSDALYYDITALQPAFKDGTYWHMGHGFPDEHILVGANYGSSPSMHALLVRSLGE